MRRHAERANAAAHREQACLQNIDRVDLFYAGAGNGVGNRALLDPLSQHLATLRGEHLGIGEPADLTTGIENDARCVHRSRERSATGFVHPADQHQRYAHTFASPAGVMFAGAIFSMGNSAAASFSDAFWRRRSWMAWKAF